MVLFIEEQKCEHVANNDVEWVVDSAASHHVIPTKGLFTMYKEKNFGAMKMGNSNYLKIVEIGDVCIETSVGNTVILKVVQHVLDLRMNEFFRLAMDQASYYNYLGNGRWKLTKGSLVVARGHACCGMYKTHVKTYKKKFNEIKDFEKTPQMRVGINGVDTKRIRFSFLDSALKEEVIGDEEYEDAKSTWNDDEVKDLGGLRQGEQYPSLKIVEP